MLITLIAFGILFVAVCGIVVTKRLEKYGDKCQDTYWEIQNKIDVARAIGRPAEEVERLEKESKKAEKKKLRYFNKDWSTPSCIFSVTAFFVGIVCCIIAIGLIVNHLPVTVDADIAQIEMEREQLIYRMETKPEAGNELLYKDILKFNQMVYKNNYYYNNPWTSWFFSEKYLAIQPIEYME